MIENRHFIDETERARENKEKVSSILVDDNMRVAVAVAARIDIYVLMKTMKTKQQQQQQQHRIASHYISSNRFGIWGTRCVCVFCLVVLLIATLTSLSRSFCHQISVGMDYVIPMISSITLQVKCVQCKWIADFSQKQVAAKKHTYTQTEERKEHEIVTEKKRTKHIEREQEGRLS